MTFKQLIQSFADRDIMQFYRGCLFVYYICIDAEFLTEFLKGVINVLCCFRRGLLVYIANYSRLNIKITKSLLCSVVKFSNLSSNEYFLVFFNVFALTQSGIRGLLSGLLL
jgi:hypothetical protein